MAKMRNYSGIEKAIIPKLSKIIDEAKEGTFLVNNYVFDFKIKDGGLVWNLIPHSPVTLQIILLFLSEIRMVNSRLSSTGTTLPDIDYEKNDLIIWDKITGLTQIMNSLDQEISLLFKDMPKKNIGFLEIKKGKPFYRFRNNHSGEYIMLSKKDKKRMLLN